MKKTLRRLSEIVISLLLLGTVTSAISFRGCSQEQPFTGKALEYYNDLLEEGFPESYAEPLTRLHLLHPDWVFVPLMVTEKNEEFTWSYVIEKETESPSLNVISPAETCRPYRHKLNTDTYDSGYYQASTAAVSYFMDPRNFLNEADIFQFYDFSTSKHENEKGLEAVLYGTFMQDGILENGMTYAEYLADIGEKLGIDPVYLAVKIHQEQGVAGTSPIISGTAGTLLWNYYYNQTQFTDAGKAIKPPVSGYTEEELLAYNGLYNYYNINATGSGLFSIYKNALSYAKKGTADMADVWGNGGAWNTRWKSLYGGAYFICKNYISVGQNSIYLQKFNVCSTKKSASFTHQYMTNVAGALSEGRTLYRSFASTNALDSDCVFRIPVYGGMPKNPCADPADGGCYLSPSTSTYSYSVSVNSPAATATNSALFFECSAANGQTLTYSGTVSHSYGLVRLQYCWDGGDWTDLEPDESWEISASVNFPEYGNHILSLRGEAAYDVDDSLRKSNRYVLLLCVDVSIIAPPTIDVGFESRSGNTSQKYYEKDDLTLPEGDGSGFVGWLEDGGTFYPAGAVLNLTEELNFRAVYAGTLSVLPGAAITTTGQTQLGFSVAMLESDWEALSALSSGSCSVRATVYRENQVANGTLSESIQTATDGTVWHLFTVWTSALSGSDLSALYRADFVLHFHYSEESTRDLHATGIQPIRSAKQVAGYALADRYSGLNESERSILSSLLG